MSIRWDTRNKRWRFEYKRATEAGRQRLSRLLPRGWSRAQADAYDVKETGRLFALASGIERRQPLIDEAVALYLRDKTGLKSYRATAEHLAAIAWAYMGKQVSELAAVAALVTEYGLTGAPKPPKDFEPIAPATIRNRLAVLKAAVRWAWKKHNLTASDPTTQMQLPSVKNERHVYIGRKAMLQACRACGNWQAQIAIRVAFYSGMRLGELYAVQVEGSTLVLHDSKNGDRRAVPAHPKIRHLLQHLPLVAPKITVQRAWQVARRKVGLEHVTIHDLRHSAASEMVNAGVDLYTVGKVLGHRDSRSTARYSHLAADTLAAAVGRIGAKRRA
jgi:integrase